ncbi:BGL1A [Scenedesmus sp. PABB004]|nr:BGL1A [Scenedesmus sp. PABB004]
MPPDEQPVQARPERAGGAAARRRAAAAAAAAAVGRAAAALAAARARAALAVEQRPGTFSPRGERGSFGLDGGEGKGRKQRAARGLAAGLGRLRRPSPLAAGAALVVGLLLLVVLAALAAVRGRPKVRAAAARAAAASSATAPASSGGRDGRPRLGAKRARTPQIDPRLSASLPDAPDECSAALRSKIAWGVATSAYQVEGAASEGGRSPSIWDAFSARPGAVAGNATGSVAADHYHHFRDDIRLMVALGVKHYRLSLSWTRVLPGAGRGSEPSGAGLRFYRRLLRELHAAGITPVVTLCHMDLPQALQDAYGGALDPQLADDFLYYADTVFAALGGYVKHWLTFSEPMAMCQLGYGVGAYAPGLARGAAGQYACGHALLLAHGRAAQLYRQKYGQAQGGRVSIALAAHWGLPYDPASTADVNATELYMTFQLGWLADPLFFGDYPEAMRRSQPSLPRLKPSERALLTGSVDFVAINYYTSHFVRAPPPGAPRDQLYEESLTDHAGAYPGPPSDTFWQFTAPGGLRSTLAWIGRRYQRPEVWVTENGVASPGEGRLERRDALKDRHRLDFYRSSLDALCAAVTRDNANLAAYFAWSLLDGFEWSDGYGPRYGLVLVDRASPRLARYPKLSAYWLATHFFRYAPDSIACLEIRSCRAQRSSLLPAVRGGAMSAAPAGKRREAAARGEEASPPPDLPEPLVLHVLGFLPPALRAWTARLVCKAARERFRGATVVSLRCPELPLAAVQEAWRAVQGAGLTLQRPQLIGARAACGDVAGLAWLHWAGCGMGGVCLQAAEHGQLAVLEWARGEGLDLKEVCKAAAWHGQLAVLEWARDQGLDLRDVCWAAAGGGHLDVLHWARAQAPPLPWGDNVCSWAARRGDLEMLRWARAQAEPAPWGEHVCCVAAQFGQLEVLRWLRAHGCPWWRGECERKAALYGRVAVVASRTHRAAAAQRPPPPAARPWPDAARPCGRLTVGPCRPAQRQVARRLSGGVMASLIEHSLSCLTLEGAPSPLPELPEPLVLHVLSFLPPALQAWAAKLVCRVARERFRGATVVSLRCPELPLAAVQEAWRAVGIDEEQQRQLSAARAASADVAGLAWLRGAGCDMWAACSAAAEHGHLAVLEWARDQGLDPGDVCWAAAQGGRLDVLRWARAQAPPLPWGDNVCSWAAQHGDLEMLRWARAQAEPAPWDRDVCWRAAEYGQLEALRWLRANGCPWWRGECEFLAASNSHQAVVVWIRAQPE